MATGFFMRFQKRQLEIALQCLEETSFLESAKRLTITAFQGRSKKETGGSF